MKQINTPKDLADSLARISGRSYATRIVNGNRNKVLVSSAGKSLYRGGKWKTLSRAICEVEINWSLYRLQADGVILSGNERY